MNVDASIVPVPVQHISKKDRETLDRGENPEEWKRNPAIKAQRDIAAAWTRKHNKSYFGYKNHIKVDSRTKLIRTFEVTPANMHDSPRWVSCSAASKIKVRARVEHTFGAMRMKVGDVRIRSIGEIRTTFVIGMRNLLYNICRVDSIKRIPVEMG